MAAGEESLAYAARFCSSAASLTVFASAALIVERDLVLARQRHGLDATAPPLLPGKLAVTEQNRADHRAAGPEFPERFSQQFVKSIRCAHGHYVASFGR